MQCILVAHNVRSIHNVGSLLRTAECLGVQEVILSGYTPYPKIPEDQRLPHEAERLHNQIRKTALGAEDMLTIRRYADLSEAIDTLRKRGIPVMALEQDNKAIVLPEFKPTESVAILVGNEVKGLETSDIKLCDGIIEIPMHGSKESLNVVQAAAMALYQTTFWKYVVK